MYQYLFGPVPSRRLGMSLGVDLVTHKICSLDCVYCECGETTDLTSERSDYVPLPDVLSELEDYFKHHPDPDYVTFSGSGEPTLNRHIGEVVLWLKTHRPGVKVAVLTNGTLLHDPEVRSALMPADLVMPSLDAAVDNTFEQINRPDPGIDLEAYIQGIADFSRDFKGRLALEVLILAGVNDSDENLDALKRAIDRIHPDVVQLNTLDRPGTVGGITAATPTELRQIARRLGEERVEIIAAIPRKKEMKAYRQDMASAILETLQRRPCTAEDLALILDSHVNEINKYLSVLEGEETLVSSRQDRGIFYKVAR